MRKQLDRTQESIKKYKVRKFKLHTKVTKKGKTYAFTQ